MRRSSVDRRLPRRHRDQRCLPAISDDLDAGLAGGSALIGLLSWPAIFGVEDPKRRERSSFVTHADTKDERRSWGAEGTPSSEPA
ncbi:MAG: hypothetical protein WA862_04285 [Solirubrobacterales bacterium]